MKNIHVMLVLVLALALNIWGCGTKSTVILISDPAGKVGEVVVSNKAGETVLDEVNQSVTVKSSSKSPGRVVTLSESEIKDSFSTVFEAQPALPVYFIFYFFQDSNELTDDSKALIPGIVKAVQKRKDPDIVITGHTDTAGTKEYNYRLGLERARLLESILLQSVSDLKNITVTSHGEGSLLIKTADDVSEAKNRRVEVVVK